MAAVVDELADDRREGDEAAVRADDGNGAVAVADVSGRVLADALDRRRDPVVQEHLEE